MISQRNDKFNYVGSAVFLLLFCIFAFAFTGNLRQHAIIESPYKFASELQSNSAALLVENQDIHFLNNHISLTEKSNINHFCERFKIVADDNSALQQIIFLRLAGLRIKPVILQRCYMQFHFIDTDPLPLLS